ncbi:hypothetical protein BDV26DRAFT_266869 [Aspergillus bertholletiae]|uniref:Uncharacterized protein n=1 Tax=Aspergillus bertholletiae TaxID=1226010 RepID=A0A5N7B431_9EURO|nr:hypothetical protein BDV26DRAFT_266869 [Aspergillus bertholletiae]
MWSISHSVPKLRPSDPFVWPWAISPFTFMSSCFKKRTVPMNHTTVRCASDTRQISCFLLGVLARRACLVLPNTLAILPLEG